MARPLRIAGLACSLAVILPPLCGSAWAATTIAYQMDDGIARTYFRDGGRVRMQNVDGTYPDSAMVVDLDAKRAYLLYDDIKQYFDMYKRLRENRKALGPLRAVARQALRAAGAEQVKIVPMGETRTVGGFSCSVYRRLVNGRAEEELCTVPWGPTVPGREDTDWMQTAMGQWMEVLLGPMALPRVKEGDRLPGFPVSRKDIKADGSLGAETRVVSVKLDPIPASLFVVPADYRQVDHPLKGPGSSSSPRLATEPAPEPSRAAPQRHRWSAVGVVLLLIAATVGLLVHGTLIHLAALMVLNRPRFGAALLAAFIVWVMALPLQLLHVRMVLTTAVGLLAGFGSLKIAYGATDRRTLALFVVSMTVTAFLSLGLGIVGRLVAAVAGGR